MSLYVSAYLEGAPLGLLFLLKNMDKHGAHGRIIVHHQHTSPWTALWLVIMVHLSAQRVRWENRVVLYYLSKCFRASSPYCLHNRTGRDI
jgi:hypothetical protein